VSILFSNMALVPLAALIALPILIHLFARARPPVYRYSSVEFIRRLVRETRRLRKPRDWLLLALRTLAFAALIGLFLRPLLFGRRLPGAGGQGRNVVVIVDATASMAWADGSQSRFVAACTEAAEVLGGLSARDRANVVWLRAPPRAVLPELGANISYLKDSLRRAQVSAESAEPADALRLAADMLRKAEGRKEICIVSDFQKTQWQTPGEGVPADIAVSAVSVARREAENLALARIDVLPARPLADEEVAIYCEVRNFSAAPKQASVFLEAGELRERQPVSIAAWGRASAAFKGRFKSAGVVPVTASIGEDAFAMDNTAWAAVRVKPDLQVGLLDADAATAACWRRALLALGWARPLTVSADNWAEAGGCDALMLAGWAGGQPEGLRALLTNGLPVIWLPAPGTPAAALAAVCGAPAPAAPSPAFAWEQPRDPLRLEIAAPDDPLFRLFAGGEYGDPAGGVLRGRLSVPAVPGADPRVLMRYTEGTPALARYRCGGGTLVLWNLAVRPDAGNWSGRMEFLPLLGELLLTERARERAALLPDAFRPGESLALRLERPTLTEDLTLMRGAAPLAPLSRRAAGAGSEFVSPPAPETGLYTWRLGDETVGYSVVNLPPEESDLRCLSAPAIARSGWSALDGGRRVRDLRDGVPLWPWLLGLAALFGLMETATAWWAAKT